MAAASCTAVAFAAVPLPDVWAMGREDRRARPPTVAGALRTVLVGAAVPQAVAVRWTGTAACPACGVDDESLWHRLWECPGWAATRRELGTASVPEGAPPGFGDTGVLALDMALVERRAMTSAAPQPPPVAVDRRSLYRR